jgi:hypothetical protein
MTLLQQFNITQVWFCFLKQCTKIWFLCGKTLQLLRNEPSENFRNWFTWLLFYLLTYSMEQSPWKAHWFSASQEIPRILWNLKVHCDIHKCPPPVSIVSPLPHMCYMPRPCHFFHDFITWTILGEEYKSLSSSLKWSLALKFPYPNLFFTPYVLHAAPI